MFLEEHPGGDGGGVGPQQVLQQVEYTNQWQERLSSLVRIIFVRIWQEKLSVTRYSV